MEQIRARAVGVVGAAVVGLLLAAVPAQGQQTPMPQTAELDEETLEEFAHAYLDVQEIRREMEEKLNTVADPQEAQGIQQEYNTRILAKIEEHDFEPEEYQGIVTALNQDPELRDEFFPILERVQEERDG